MKRSVDGLREIQLSAPIRQKTGEFVTGKLRWKLMRRWLRRAVTTSFFMPLFVQGQEMGRSTTQPILPGATETGTMQQQDLSHHEFSGEVRLESMQYLTSLPKSPDLNNSQLMSARIATLGSFNFLPSLEYAADGSAGTYFRPNQSEFVIHEANLSAHVLPAVAISVGRKKAFWSELDSRWQLGLWQPQFAIDALRPEDQGLTGAFLDFEKNNVHLMGFASPVFLPATGPSVREQNGSLVSDSRWYSKPASELIVNSRSNPIDYKLQIPDTNDVVFNPSTAFLAQWGQREMGPWVASAWGHKPVNELLLRRQNFQSTNSQVGVTVAPEVTYHEIASADIGYSTANMQASLSYLQDRPEEKTAPADWAIQRLDPIHAYSAQLDYSFNNSYTRTLQLQLGYLKVQGGGITEVRSNGQPDDFQLFDQRLKFTDATSIGIQGELAHIMHRALITKVRYLYDRDQKGSLLNTEFLMSLQRRLAVLAGADLLGVEDENYRPSSFLNQFRANGRVYGGMTYAF